MRDAARRGAQQQRHGRGAGVAQVVVEVLEGQIGGVVQGGEGGRGAVRGGPAEVADHPEVDGPGARTGQGPADRLLGDLGQVVPAGARGRERRRGQDGEIRVRRYGGGEQLGGVGEHHRTGGQERSALAHGTRGQFGQSGDETGVRETAICRSPSRTP
ncbi:hypothetical protein [Streptomyces malaysiensis]|uniref:hypothetical protein n=1 Tax=Streptomyces malaysiensis TaxID=92644 RepID=UPI00371DC18C